MFEHEIWTLVIFCSLHVQVREIIYIYILTQVLQEWNPLIRRLGFLMSIALVTMRETPTDVLPYTHQNVCGTDIHA